jgi:GTP:adenosylcobinamide-phosphate guanylyltransferase
VKAVVTAGGRVEGEYARLAGTTCKALAPVRGITMLEHVVAALRGCGVDAIAVVGDQRIERMLGDRVERYIADQGSGERNVIAALMAWPEDGDPLLYATSDMPYIDTASLRQFVCRVPSDALAMPLIEGEDFEARFPGASGFGITLAGQRVVNGGVFHIAAGSATRVANTAARLFNARKSAWRMATIAGAPLLARWVFGRLSLEMLETRARALVGGEVLAVRGCCAELGFDADSADAYRYALTHA